MEFSVQVVVRLSTHPTTKLSKPDDEFSERFGYVKKEKRRLLKVFITFFVIMSIGIGLYSQIVNSYGTEDNVNKQTEFQKATGTTTEQENNILNILKVCGIEK
jgi:hypothetical protein